jgi:HlyD family secretion protein
MANVTGPRSVLSLAVAFLVGLAGGAAAAYFYLGARPTQTAGDRTAAKGQQTRVAAPGRLEPAGGVINLAAPGPDVVEKFLVQDGATVNKDQELAVLGSQKLRQIEYDTAQIQLKEAEEKRSQSLTHLRAQLKESDARIKQLETQGPLDVQIQERKIRVLEQQHKTAQDLVARMKQAGGSPQQEIEQQDLLRVQAEQELAGARAALTKIKEADAATLDAAKAQREVVESDLRRAGSETSLEALRKSLELANERLRQSVVRSPIAGKVLKILAREGELVGTQPVFQIADPGAMVAVAEVYETDVTSVREWLKTGRRVDADVEIKLPGGGGSKFRGQVVSVASLVMKNSSFALDPRQDVDRRVVEVRIRLDDAFNAPAAEFINMQVDVTIYDPKGPKPE